MLNLTCFLKMGWRHSLCCLWHGSIININLQIWASRLCNKLPMQCSGDLTEFISGWRWKFLTWHRRAQHWAHSCFGAMLVCGGHNKGNPEVNSLEKETCPIDQRQSTAQKEEGGCSSSQQNSRLVTLWSRSRVGPNNTSYPIRITSICLWIPSHSTD